MKQMKMYEKELAKLDGQQIMLEQQKMMIESTNFDVGVISSIKAGKDAMKEMNKNMELDDIQDLKDDLEDQMAEMNEKQEFFAGIANEGNDELLGELDELEALAMDDELKAMDSVPVKPIPKKNQQQAVAQAEEEDEDEKMLQAMMMWVDYIKIASKIFTR